MMGSGNHPDRKVFEHEEEEESSKDPEIPVDNDEDGESSFNPDTAFQDNKNLNNDYKDNGEDEEEQIQRSINIDKVPNFTAPDE